MLNLQVPAETRASGCVPCPRKGKNIVYTPIEKWDDAPSPIVDLAGLVNIGHPADVLLAFIVKAKLKVEKARLVGAFDASGKEDQRCLVVAGFISSAADWQSFHTQWTERLKADGLTHFHMVDFAHSQGEFIGWKDDETHRRNLLAGLMEIIQSHVYRKFGCVIENSEFDQLSEENQREFGLNAYSLAGRTCVADVSKWKKQEGLSHVPTGYVFEEGDEGAGELSRRMFEDGHSQPHFLPKKDRTGPDGSPINAYTPLQAADMFAYELAKPFKDLLEGKPRVESFRWGFNQFDHIPGEPGYYSPKNLVELNVALDSLHPKDKGTGLPPDLGKASQ